MISYRSCSSPDVDHLLQTQLQGLQGADPVILKFVNVKSNDINIEIKSKLKMKVGKYCNQHFTAIARYLELSHKIGHLDWSHLNLVTSI